MPKTFKLPTNQGAEAPMENETSSKYQKPNNPEAMPRYLTTSEYCRRRGLTRPTIIHRRKEDPEFDAKWVTWGGRNFIAIKNVEAEEAQMEADAVASAQRRATKRASVAIESSDHVGADHRALIREAADAVRQGERRIMAAEGEIWINDPYFLKAPLREADVRDPYFRTLRLLVGAIPADIREKLCLPSNAAWWDVWSAVTRDKSEEAGRKMIEVDNEIAKKVETIHGKAARLDEERRRQKFADKVADAKATKAKEASHG